MNGRSRFGLERYLRGFLDLLTVVFMGRYRYRPLHLFGGIGLLLGGSGFGSWLYLTVVKIGGAGIGGRPLLLLGVLLLVVGIQFLSLGLIGEMLTSHHEEKAGGAATSARARRAALTDSACPLWRPRRDSPRRCSSSRADDSRGCFGRGAFV